MDGYDFRDWTYDDEDDDEDLGPIDETEIGREPDWDDVELSQLPDYDRRME